MKRFGQSLSRRGRRGPAIAIICGASSTLAPHPGGYGDHSVCMAAPQPEVIPRRWQLDVEPSALRVVTIDVPGLGPRTYFYLTFTVVNNSGEDVPFFPAFYLYTDQGEQSRSGRDVPQEAVNIIREIASRGHVDLKSELEVQGLLLQGRENAKEGLAVWPCRDFDVDEVNVFLEGFSGETRTVKRPDTGENVTIRKTMKLDHEVPGQIDPSSRRPLTRVGVSWVLR